VETVLITGTGLIAAYTARELIERGQRVVLVSPHAAPGRLRPLLGEPGGDWTVERADMRDVDQMRSTIARHGVRRVLQAGGLGGTRVAEQPAEGFDVNVRGVLTLLEACRSGGVERTVLVSSIWVYRVDPPLRLDVPAAETLDYGLPSTLYAAYKTAAEVAARGFSRHTGISVLQCRVAGAYGRGDFSGGGETGGLLQETVLRAVTEPAGTRIPVTFRAGERIYGRDVADALVRALFVETPPHDVYNVGSGEIMGPGELGAAINAAVPGAQVQAHGGATADTPLVDLTRAWEELGYTPRWPVSRAIPDFVAQLRGEGLGSAG
jgi:nucleoside-diphosphate-sugar epimerase